MKHLLVRLGLVLCAAVVSCEKTGGPTDAAGTLQVTSTVLQEGKPVPPAFACTDYEHLGTSPHLAWSQGPSGTIGYAVTVIDPDAEGFVHWGLLGIPASTTSLAGGVSPGGPLPAGATDLTNDFDKPGYGGPCPPPGSPHHYVFKVYALKKPVQGTRVDAALLRTLDTNALATGSITVTFQR